MKQGRTFFLLFVIVFYLNTSFLAFSQDNSVKPEWWKDIDFQMEKKDYAVEQYFYIKDNLLRPAYKATGRQRGKGI